MVAPPSWHWLACHQYCGGYLELLISPMPGRQGLVAQSCMTGHASSTTPAGPTTTNEVWLWEIHVSNRTCKWHHKIKKYTPVNEDILLTQGSTLSFLAGCPKSHFLGWYRNFFAYWYLKLDNQVVNWTCPKDKLGWIWRADDPKRRTL